MATGRDFDVAVRALPVPRATISRMLLGSRTRDAAARFEVVILDRSTGETVASLPADGTRHEAEGLGHVVRDDLERLDQTAFLNKYAQRTRGPKSPRRRLLG